MPDFADSTVAYYDRSAARYFEATVAVDMSPARARFLRHVPPGARILDAGSGSGRDTLAFLKEGYHMEAFDPSTELAALSTKLTGIRTRVASFQDLSEVERYDGIWACGSLLHVPRSELAGVFDKCRRALTRGGALFASFREGQGEHTVPDGRRFTDLTESELEVILRGLPGLVLRESWRTEDKNSSGRLIAWLNAILARES
jgi:SAM-dependent methyltransferase